MSGEFSQAEIQAFLDDRLGPERRAALEAHLAAYGERISRLFSSLNSAERDALVADIRQSGKRISDISEQVVFFEKNPVMSG